MPTVGLLYICTGRYTVFWPDFYKSFAKNFLPACQKEFFVFTDAEQIEFENEPGVHRIYQQAYDWPYSTLKRFSIFLQAEEALKKLDYLFFSNANLLCEQTVTEAEFLPRKSQGENLLVVQQPGFWDKQPPFYTYDRNPKSRAYIPYNCGQYYVSGGLNGGYTPAFLALCHELERRTEEDLAHGVIALWHDESQLNRYIAERQDYRLLTPAYWYPQGWQLPFTPKITVRDKAKWIDMGAVKGEKPPVPYLLRKYRAFCENYMPYLYCWRDKALGKKLLPATDGCGKIEK
ncbi:MAG: family 6 glucosyltransferase [Gemmiger sp.]|nr:family 6 glucosyltransferase [Gemmiger sp.]